MSLTKQVLKSKPVTKVTFRLPPEATAEAKTVFLVGDFNDWNPQATPMTRLKSGEFKVTLNLQIGRDYSFRYLIEGQEWENDWAADRYVPSGIEGAENSVVTV
ncbi:MAG: isoamylase early set domain-containing protein [Gemmatimonadales bacterium]|nr:isoamylase early set domain-containing protein [Gemmatimonadales bacterium]